MKKKMKEKTKDIQEETKEAAATQLKVAEPEDSSGQDISDSMESSEAPAVSVEEKLRKELERVQAQAKQYLDTMQRLKAEFDNYRKRMEKERKRLSELHQSIVIEALFPTLDAFDAALEKSPEGDIAEFREGMKLVHQGLMDQLRKLGLERMELLGKPFDPELADAMMTAPSDEYPPDTIIQVVTAGYRFKNRVIRPGKVVVAKQKEES